MTISAFSKVNPANQPVKKNLDEKNSLIKRSTIQLKSIYEALNRKTDPQKIFEQRVKEYGETEPKLSPSGRPCTGVFGSVEKIKSMPDKVLKRQKPARDAAREVKGLPGDANAKAKSRTERYAKLAKDEADLHRMLQKSGARHLARLDDSFFLNQQEYIMVMEDVGPTLADIYLNLKNTRKATLAEIQKFGREALETLMDMHELGYGHFDIKPQNYSGNLNKTSTFRTLDFGISEHQNSPTLQKYHKQSLWYRSPETEFEIRNHLISDIFALGCVLYELYTKSPLFKVKSDKDEYINMLHAYFGRLSLSFDHLPDNIKKMFASIKPNVKNNLIDTQGPEPVLKKGTMPPLRPFYVALNDHRDYRDKIKFEPLTEEHKKRFDLFIDLLNQMLEFDPQKRISAKEAFKHPFFEMNPLAPPQMKTAIPVRPQAGFQLNSSQSKAPEDEKKSDNP